MAAKLKKRALAEYQSQVLEEDRETVSPENKRLKLSLKSESPEPEPEPVESILPVLDTEVASAREVLENIASFDVNAVTNQSTEAIVAAVKKISEALSKEKDECVKAQLVRLWGEVVGLASSEEVPAKLEDFISLNEKSSKVMVSWLTALKKLVNVLSLSKGLRQKVFSVGCRVLLSSPHPVVHSKALDLLSCLVTPDIPSISGQALELCGSYSMSQDARVRTAAFHGLLTIHRRGVRLDVSMYSVFCKALSDDYEGVRCQALRLLSALALTQPEFQVELEGNSNSQTNRLVDDVFSRTCQAINDVRENVRVLAASLIGEMRGVSQMFLEQTLDKKLMSNMRMKRNAHERMANLVNSGEWSSGKRWADDAPKEEIDAEQVNLVTFGSCGAFVHGLEDECLSVRVATVQSLSNLAVNNQELAVLALDFLTDMFNDEIEQVRLEAIGALTAIAQHIKLQVHQLEVILGALDDYSTLLREKLHLMLQSCSLATKDGLNMVIDKLLLVNLKRYPQDRRSIYVTFKHLGANHPDLTLPLVSSLLKIHPYFDKQEEDIEDPSYLCKLILVLNAAQHCPTLPMLLDSHTHRHHDYLRDTFPHLMPASSSSVSASATSASSQTYQFLQSVLARVSSTSKLPAARAISVLNTSSSELLRLAGIDTSLADLSCFARMYIECQALLLRVVTDLSWTQASLQQGPVITTNMSSLQSLVLQLQSMFNNIGEENQLLLRMLKLKVMAVTLVFTVCRSDKSALGPTEQFIKEFDALVKEMKQEEIVKDSFLQGVISVRAGAEVKPGYLARELQPLLLSSPAPGLSSLPLKVKMTRAVINEPVSGAETALKYMAGLVLGIPLDCEVRNIHRPELLRICIFTGDQHHHLSIPRRGDLVAQTDGTYRLLTTALMSHSVWSEPSDVEISLVLDLGPERLVHLCKPVKVSVLPKPVRRGI